MGAVSGQRHQRKHTDQHRIPVKNPSVRTELKVRPEGLEEIAGGIERNSAHHVAERGPKEYAQQNAGDGEDDVKELLPDGSFNVGAELNADGPQHEEPQNHHQGKVEAAETGCIELGESKVKRGAGSQQPDFISIPDWTDGAQNAPPFLGRFARDQIDHARSQIEAIEHDIHRHHYADNPKPYASHSYLASIAGWESETDSSSTGPFSISRRMRNRNKIPSTVYMPMNPRRVNMPLPAETALE